MIKILIVLMLLIPVLLIGQKSTNINNIQLVYKDISGLTIPDSVSVYDLIGGFNKTDGFGGSNYLLDLGMSFKKRSFSCMSRFQTDSGSWVIRNKNNLILISKQKTIQLEIFKYDNYYFFILPSQKQGFFRALETSRVKLKHAKPYELNSIKYSVEYLIGYDVSKSRKYYAKELQ